MAATAAPVLRACLKTRLAMVARVSRLRFLGRSERPQAGRSRHHAISKHTLTLPAMKPKPLRHRQPTPDEQHVLVHLTVRPLRPDELCEDIAQFALYLASDLAGVVTGGNVPIDSGYLAFTGNAQVMGAIQQCPRAWHGGGTEIHSRRCDTTPQVRLVFIRTPRSVRSSANSRLCGWSRVDDRRPAHSDASGLRWTNG